MQLIQTAPGQVFAISTSNGCVLTQEGMPDSIELSKGQSHVIAKGDWIQIDDTTALIYPVQGTTREVSVSLIGFGSLPGLSAFITNLITSIVGPGNASATFDTATATLTVAFASDVTKVQIAQVESLLERLLPKDVGLEIDPLPTGYIIAEFLESTDGGGMKRIKLPIWFDPAVDSVQIKTEHNGYNGFFNPRLSAEGVYRPKGFAYGHYRPGEVLWMTAKKWGVVADYVDMSDGNYHVFELISTPELHRFYADGKLYHENNEDLSAVSGQAFSLFGTSFAQYPFAGKKKYWQLEVNGRAVADLIPCLDAVGIPCMFNKIDKTSHYAYDRSGLIAGFTLEQALNLSKLPITQNGTLTVSLPWESQWIAGVQDALNTASTKGWTITVQYRDPEVATANIPISFLESTKTQYIKTDYIPNNATGGIVKGLHSNFFNGDNMVAGMRNDTTDTRWCISGIDLRALSGWGPLIAFDLPVKNHSLFVGTTNWKNDRKCSISYPNLGLTEVKTLGDLPFTPISVLGIYGMLRADGNIYPWAGRLFSVSLSQGEEVVRNFIPTLDTLGIPCMYDCITNQLFYNNGTGAFIAGFDTAEQALKLATLPDVTAETDAAKKSLTVSLPGEAQLTSTGVPAALQVAADRGWTITVQYRED